MIKGLDKYLTQAPEDDFGGYCEAVMDKIDTSKISDEEYEKHFTALDKKLEEYYSYDVDVIKAAALLVEYYKTLL